MKLSPDLKRWLRRRLFAWGSLNFRRFAWRGDRDPYRTLITEVLLRQTSARHVAQAREGFLATYPDSESLAVADSRVIATMIAQIGLSNQRAPQLVSLGKALSTRRGRVPTRVAALSRLPGVGTYTAAAVACFAFGRPEPALDVNVARILGRVLDIRPTRGELRKNRSIAIAARTLLDGPHPREMNWALLDLGALVCKPVPRCNVCPIRQRCRYFDTASASE